jgi:hypothetical protein
LVAGRSVRRFVSRDASSFSLGVSMSHNQ